MTQYIRNNWFALTAGLLCFIWAFAAWLAVDPNQDILADAIQAQTLLSDPRIVLSFPGQKHGGPLEYPFTILAEWIAPGNFYANAAIRPIFAFLTGFFAAKLFLRLFADAPRWSFLLAVATGPVIIHGYIGPFNAVGVWWLQPNWDLAWLLVTIGLYVFSTQRLNSSKAVLAGFLVGLGFFAHPAVIILIVPLTVLTLLRRQPQWPRILIASGGFLIGIAPAIVSYFVNNKINTWDPSHGLFISFDWYWNMGRTVLGLSGIPDHMLAILPYAAGLSPDQTLFSGVFQSFLMWILITAVISFSILGLVKSVRTRKWPTATTSLSLAWLSLIFTLFAFITVIDQVWLYSASLAILYWISLGALPSLFKVKALGVSITALILVIATASTVSHNRFYYRDYFSLINSKSELQNSYKESAQSLVEAGATFIFGSYLNVIPIGYASSLKLRTITQTYNRFPITDSELLNDSIRVAVDLDSMDRAGNKAIEIANEECSPVASVSIPTGFEIFDCPPTALITE